MDTSRASIYHNRMRDDVIFRFPVKLEDLRSSIATNSYQVFNVYSVSDAVQQIKDSHAESSWDYMEQLFDTYYSFLINFDQTEKAEKDAVWKKLVKTIGNLYANMNDLLANAESEQMQDKVWRRQKCNMLKMTVYVLTQAMQLFEEYVRKESETIDAKGRKKAKDVNIAYEKEKELASRSLLNLFSLHLNWIFDPQIVEEDFVNCITTLCWKLLDNPSIGKQKALLDHIGSLLGISLERHRQSLNFSLNLIQLLRQKESHVNIMINLVERVIKDHGQNDIINEIIRNIDELNKQELGKDTAGARALSNFLSDLSRKCIEPFIGSISMLSKLLEDDPYMLRNCTFNIIGQLVSNHFSQPDMDREAIEKRDELLGMLEDHLLDANTFSRGAVLKVFSELCTQQKLPIQRLYSVVQKAVNRLSDRSTYVRKQAVNFLTVFIQNNSFKVKDANLEQLKAHYEKQKQRLDEAMQKLIPSPDADNQTTCDNEQEQAGEQQQDAEMNDADTELSCDEDRDSEADKENQGQERQKKSRNSLPMDQLDEINQQVTDEQDQSRPVEDIRKQEIIVEYLQICINFATELQKALPLVGTLLQSKSVTDIKEAIDFFVVAAKYDVDGAVNGIRTLISLIFSNEKDVQNSIMDAFIEIYINSVEDPMHSTRRERAKEVINRFTELVMGATVGETVALEQVLTHLALSGKIDKLYVDLMWERFQLKAEGTSDEQSRIAVLLISMLANANASIVRDNFDLLIDNGLGKRAEVDLELAVNTLIALRKASRGRGKVDPKETIYRFPVEHRLFERVSELLLFHLKDAKNDAWLLFLNEAIKIIFVFSYKPNQLAERLIYKFIDILLSHDKEASNQKENKSADLESDEAADTNKLTNDLLNISLPSYLLSRFISLLGEIAINELLYIEMDIATEIKIRSVLKQNKEENNSKTKKSDVKTPNRRKSLSAPKTPSDGNLDEEMGLAGAQADDDTDFLQIICNNEVVSSIKPGVQENLLCRMAGIIVTIASDPIKYSDIDLQKAASLALSKFMLVSEKFCRQYLRHFFTIFNGSCEPAIKINCIIACGDLCVRFPNLLDPWTPHLYSTLKNRSLHVRATTFKVVSRLILSDMIKIKEQISEVAKIIVDPDNSLAQMAVMFFNELARKNNNAIYNILPDIVSHLSNASIGIPEEDFQTVAKCLIELIEKDKHVIGIVDKFCQRFKLVDSEREFKDLSFCLSLLKLSERSIQRICENLPFYADKLVFNQVYQNFQTVVANAKKVTGIKNETKEALETLANKMEVIRQKGLEDPTAVEVEEGAEAAAAATATSAEVGRTPLRNQVAKTVRKAASSSKKQASAKKQPTRRSRRKLWDDDEDESGDDEPRPTTSKLPTRVSGRPTRSTRATRVIEEESEEDDD